MELLIILILIFLNGTFALFEIALVSSRKTKLQEKTRHGNTSAQMALRLREKPENILSTVQVGITLIGIIAGVYGGRSLADNIIPWFINIPALEPYAESLAVAVIVGLITYLSLVLGELVPKTIALNNPERYSMFLSPVMRIIGILTYPVVWFLSLSTRAVTKTIGLKPRDEAPVSEEELRILLRQSSEYGVIEKEESQIIHDVFRFGDMRAGTIMTRRPEIEWIDLHSTTDEIADISIASKYSKLPVCEASAENIRGVVAVRDMLAYYLKNKNIELEQIMQKPVYIPEQAPALKVLELFKRTKQHFGIVINEYGLMEGLITVHDLTEKIMGELPEPEEQDEDRVVKRSANSYLIDGSMLIDELKDFLDIPFVYDQNEKIPPINTLSGLCMYKLQRVPKTGDRFTIRDYHFEIAAMDGRRVEKVLVEKR